MTHDEIDHPANDRFSQAAGRSDWQTAWNDPAAPIERALL
jgi:hypothetical protein